MCQGQLLPISQHSALFAILGTTYGGNGKTTFALPNLKGAAVVHPENSFHLGKAGGDAIKQLRPENFPPHTHLAVGKIKSKSTTDTKNNPVGNYPANSGGFSDREYSTESGKKMAADSIVATVSTAGTDIIPSISNRQPYLAVNFIICMKGEFPQRS